VVHICSAKTAAIWAAVAATTVVFEIVPAPVMGPVLHYGVYTPLKLVLFLLVGYIAPLGLAKLSALNRGLAFAAVSAAVVEILQGFVGNGHSFHWYELAVKWVVIAVGFMFGLDARCERALDLGPLHVTFISDGGE